jgi:hypothetical protein
VVDAFLKSPALEKWLDKAGKRLETFAKYVGTAEFEKSVKGFVETIGAAADWIAEHAKWFMSADKPTGAHIGDRVRAWHQLAADKDLADIKSGGQSGVMGKIKSWVSPGGMTEDQLLALVGKKEGGTTSKANAWGAVGYYQIKPGTAREFGIDPAKLYTKEGNEAAARKILRAYSAKYNGNLTEILASYNQGTGAGNPATLKPEGQKYIRGSQGVHVTIENAAGSSFVTQTNMNAAGFPGY